METVEDKVSLLCYRTRLRAFEAITLIVTIVYSITLVAGLARWQGFHWHGLTEGVIPPR